MSSFLAPTSFSDPAARFVQLCSRTAMTPPEEAALRSLAKGLHDPERTWMLAERHGVAGLAVHHLHRLRLLDELPENLGERFRRYGKAVLGHNMQAMGELVRVLQACRREGIEVLPIKGPVLAQQFYGNIALRRFVDVDVVVRRPDIDAAIRVLRHLGYEIGREEVKGSVDTTVQAQLGIEMVHPDRRIVVEVHWALLNHTYNINLRPHDVWSRATNTRVGGVPVHAMQTEDLLLYLCAHGAKHHWSRLKWACDVAEVVRRSPTLNWAMLRRRAAALRCERIVSLGLAVAHRWLGAPVPLDVLRAIENDGMVKTLIEQVEAGWLFSDEPLESEPSPRRVLFTLRTRTRWRDSFRFFRHIVGVGLRPSQRDRAFVDLPAWLSIAYVFVRPTRLAWSGIGRLFRGYLPKRTTPRDLTGAGAAAHDLDSVEAGTEEGHAPTTVASLSSPTGMDGAATPPESHGCAVSEGESVASDVHA